MNVFLWILQVILAVKLVSVSYTHGLRPERMKGRKEGQSFGAATQPLLTLIALGMLLGAVALVLPAVIGVATWLTPLAAAALAVMMLAAISFHVICRESPMIPVSLVLAALSAIVAYGRWVTVPLR